MVRHWPHRAVLGATMRLLGVPPSLWPMTCPGANVSRPQDGTSVADLLAHLQSALADRYTLERELGRGGMATVYLARDLRHDRPVALKVLHPELATRSAPSGSSARSRSPRGSSTPTSCRCTTRASRRACSGSRHAVTSRASRCATGSRETPAAGRGGAPDRARGRPTRSATPTARA